MYDDPFSTSTGLTNIQDYRGELLLVTPLRVINKITKFKPGGTETAVVDFVVLSGPDSGMEFESVNVFNTPLVEAMKRRIGRDRPMLLARLETVDNPTNPDKPMWVFQAPSEEDKVTAREFLARKAAPDEENDPFKI